MALDLTNVTHTPARKKAPRIEEGTYPARFSCIVDLGEQMQTDWQTGAELPEKPRVLITWTLPTETLNIEHDDGSTEEVSRVISKEYTLSTHEKSGLYALMKGMKVSGFDVTKLLGLPCLVTVGSTINDNAKVIGCVGVPSGMEVAEVENVRFFDFDDPKEEIFDTLPGWVKDKIREATNYNGFADGWGQAEAA